MKTCCKCGEAKRFNQFHRRQCSPDGYNARCRKCITGTENTNENKPKVTEFVKNYLKQNGPSLVREIQSVDSGYTKKQINSAVTSLYHRDLASREPVGEYHGQKLYLYTLERGPINQRQAKVLLDKRENRPTWGWGG